MHTQNGLIQFVVYSREKKKPEIGVIIYKLRLRSSHLYDYEVPNKQSDKKSTQIHTATAACESDFVVNKCTWKNNKSEK